MSGDQDREAEQAEGLGALTVAELLDRLASRASVPAGGVAAAVQAAQAAALVAMAARFSVRGKDDVTDRLAAEVADEADALRARALALADEDVAAFETVEAAWSLPAGEAREAQVRGALTGAAGPPAAVVDVARDVVALAERLVAVVPPSVRADLAAAVDAAHAAASTSRRNVEANLPHGTGDGAARAIRARVADVDDLLRRAVDIIERLR